MQASQMLFRLPDLFAVVLLATATATVAKSGDLKHPDWHPDGNLLVAEGSCRGSTDLYLVDVEKQSVTFLWDGGLTEGYPRWFADGQRIAFHQINEKRESRIFVADVPAAGVISIPQMVSMGSFDIEPAPSPDGTRIAFSQAGNTGQEIALLDPATKMVTHAWKTGSGENFPSWHPDDDALIFHVKSEDSTQIWRQYIASDDRVQITQNKGPNLVGNLSADGSFLAFSSERDGDREIYVRNLDTGIDRRITDRVGRDGYPKFSPDAGRLAFHSVIDELYTEIRIFDFTSGELQSFSCEEWVENAES